MPDDHVPKMSTPCTLESLKFFQSYLIIGYQFGNFGVILPLSHYMPKGDQIMGAQVVFILEDLSVGIVVK